MRGQLQSESDDHDALRTAIELVFDDIGVAPTAETSSLAVRVTQIPDRARALARKALYNSVHRAFAIAHSHYINIELPVICEGFAPGYTDAELDKIEKEAALPAQDLAEKVGEEIPPKNV